MGWRARGERRNKEKNRDISRMKKPISFLGKATPLHAEETFGHFNLYQERLIKPLLYKVEEMRCKDEKECLPSLHGDIWALPPLVPCSDLTSSMRSTLTTFLTLQLPPPWHSRYCLFNLRFFFHSTSPFDILCIYVHYYTYNCCQFLHATYPQDRNLCEFYSLMYFKCLEQCLARSKYSMNSCWVKKVLFLQEPKYILY